MSHRMFLVCLFLVIAILGIAYLLVVQQERYHKVYGDNRLYEPRSVLRKDENDEVIASYDQFRRLPKIFSGVINDTVVIVADDEPSIFDGDVVVNSTGTLIIGRGSVIQVARSMGISVLGVIRIEGTTEAPVNFTSGELNPTPGDWKGISLMPENVVQPSELVHISIFNAGFDKSSALTVHINGNCSSPLLLNITIGSCSGDGVEIIGGVNTEFSPTNISLQDITVEETEMLRCHAVECVGDGFSFVEVMSTNVLCEDCFVSGATRHGVFMSVLPQYIKFVGFIVRDNDLSGMLVKEGEHVTSFDISSCLFENNGGDGLTLSFVPSNSSGVEEEELLPQIVNVLNCTFVTNKGSGVRLEPYLMPLYSQWNLKNAVISANEGNGLYILVNHQDQDHFGFMHISDTLINLSIPGNVPFLVSGAPYGGILLERILVADNDVGFFSAAHIDMKSDVEMGPVVMRDCIFERNRASYVITWESVPSLSSKRHIFQNNAVVSNFPATTIGDSAALSANWVQTDFVDNIIVNPLYPLELSIRMAVAENEFVNATRNYWGLVNIDMIYERIFDGNDISGIAQVLLEPIISVAQFNCSTCSGHGTCIRQDSCECEAGWLPPKCDIPSCSGLGDGKCGHGFCSAPDTCTCDVGWVFPLCIFPSCSTLNDCSGHGECIEPEKCFCDIAFSRNPDCGSCSDGYVGDFCEPCLCVHGNCTNNVPNVCECDVSTRVGQLCDRCSEFSFGEFCVPSPVAIAVAPAIVELTQKIKTSITLLIGNFHLVNTNITGLCRFSFENRNDTITAEGTYTANGLVCTIPTTKMSSYGMLHFNSTHRRTDVTVTTSFDGGIEFFEQDLIFITIYTPCTSDACEFGVCMQGKCFCFEAYIGPYCNETSPPLQPSKDKLEGDRSKPWPEGGSYRYYPSINPEWPISQAIGWQLKKGPPGMNANKLTGEVYWPLIVASGRSGSAILVQLEVLSSGNSGMKEVSSWVIDVPKSVNPILYEMPSVRKGGGALNVLGDISTKGASPFTMTLNFDGGYTTEKTVWSDDNGDISNLFMLPELIGGSILVSVRRLNAPISSQDSKVVFRVISVVPSVPKLTLVVTKNGTVTTISNVKGLLVASLATITLTGISGEIKGLPKEYSVNFLTIPLLGPAKLSPIGLTMKTLSQRSWRGVTWVTFSSALGDAMELTSTLKLVFDLVDPPPVGAMGPGLTISGSDESKLANVVAVPGGAVVRISILLTAKGPLPRGIYKSKVAMSKSLTSFVSPLNEKLFFFPKSSARPSVRLEFTFKVPETMTFGIVAQGQVFIASTEDALDLIIPISLSGARISESTVTTVVVIENVSGFQASCHAEQVSFVSGAYVQCSDTSGNILWDGVTNENGVIEMRDLPLDRTLIIVAFSYGFAGASRSFRLSGDMFITVPIERLPVQLHWLTHTETILISSPTTPLIDNVPVVTISPSWIDTNKLLYDIEEAKHDGVNLDFHLKNEGLGGAYDIRLHFPIVDLFEFHVILPTQLPNIPSSTANIGALKAGGEMVVSVLVIPISVVSIEEDLDCFEAHFLFSAACNSEESHYVRFPILFSSKESTYDEIQCNSDIPSYLAAPNIYGGHPVLAVSPVSTTSLSCGLRVCMDTINECIQGISSEHGCFIPLRDLKASPTEMLIYFIYNHISCIWTDDNSNTILWETSHFREIFESTTCIVDAISFCQLTETEEEDFVEILSPILEASKDVIIYMDLLIAVFGDIAWLNVRNVTWAERFIHSSDDLSPDGIHLSNKEISELVEAPLGIEPENIRLFLRRYNATLGRWTNGILGASNDSFPSYWTFLNSSRDYLSYSRRDDVGIWILFSNALQGFRDNYDALSLAPPCISFDFQADEMLGMNSMGSLVIVSLRVRVLGPHSLRNLHVNATVEGDDDNKDFTVDEIRNLETSVSRFGETSGLFRFSPRRKVSNASWRKFNIAASFSLNDVPLIITMPPQIAAVYPRLNRGDEDKCTVHTVIESPQLQLDGTYLQSVVIVLVNEVNGIPAEQVIVSIEPENNIPLSLRRMFIGASESPAISSVLIRGDGHLMPGQSGTLMWTYILPSLSDTITSIDLTIERLTNVGVQLLSVTSLAPVNVISTFLSPPVVADSFAMDAVLFALKELPHEFINPRNPAEELSIPIVDVEIELNYENIAFRNSSFDIVIPIENGQVRRNSVRRILDEDVDDGFLLLNVINHIPLDLVLTNVTYSNGSIASISRVRRYENNMLMFITFPAPSTLHTQWNPSCETNSTSCRGNLQCLMVFDFITDTVTNACLELQTENDDITTSLSCRSETVDGIVWPHTEINTTSIQPCPELELSILTADRYCSDLGEWDIANMDNCTDMNLLVKKLRSLLHETLSNSEVEASTVSINVVAETISNPFFDDALDVDNFVALIYELIEICRTLNFQGNTAENILSVAHKLIFSPGRGNINTDVREKMPALLEVLAISLVSVLPPNSQRTLVVGQPGNLIVIRARTIDLKSTSNMLFFGEGLPEIFDFVYVRIPNEAFRLTKSQVGGIVVYEDSSFLYDIDTEGIIVPTTSNEVVDSIVVSTVIGNRNGNLKRVDNLVEPVRIRLLQSDNLLHLCAWWDEDLETWSKDSCNLISNDGGIITCECGHLRSFALTKQISAEFLSEEDGESFSSLNLEIVVILCCGVSIAGTLVTLIMFLLIPKLRRSSTIFVMQVCFVNIAINVVFIYHMGVGFNDKMACIITIIVLHYLVLTLFSLVLSLSVSVYKTVIHASIHRTATIWQIILPWLVPFIITAVCVSIDAGNDLECWISIPVGFYGSFVAPLLLLTSATALIYVRCVMHVFSRNDLSGSYTESRKIINKRLHFMFFCTVWSCGILLAVQQANSVTTYIFSISNAFLGTLFFFFYCLKTCIHGGLRDSLTGGQWKRIFRSSFLPYKIVEDDFKSEQKLHDNSISNMAIILKNGNYALVDGQQLFSPYLNSDAQGKLGSWIENVISIGLPPEARSCKSECLSSEFSLTHIWDSSNSEESSEAASAEKNHNNIPKIRQRGCSVATEQSHSCSGLSVSDNLKRAYSFDANFDKDMRKSSYDTSQQLTSSSLLALQYSIKNSENAEIHKERLEKDNLTHDSFDTKHNNILCWINNVVSNGQSSDSKSTDDELDSSDSTSNSCSSSDSTNTTFSVLSEKNLHVDEDHCSTDEEAHHTGNKVIKNRYESAQALNWPKRLLLR